MFSWLHLSFLCLNSKGPGDLANQLYVVCPPPHPPFRSCLWEPASNTQFTAVSGGHMLPLVPLNTWRWGSISLSGAWWEVRSLQARMRAPQAGHSPLGLGNQGNCFPPTLLTYKSLCREKGRPQRPGTAVYKPRGDRCTDPGWKAVGQGEYMPVQATPVSQGDALPLWHPEKLGKDNTFLRKSPCLRFGGWGQQGAGRSLRTTNGSKEGSHLFIGSVRALFTQQ